MTSNDFDARYVRSVNYVFPGVDLIALAGGYAIRIDEAAGEIRIGVYDSADELVGDAFAAVYPAPAEDDDLARAEDHQERYGRQGR